MKKFFLLFFIFIILIFIIPAIFSNSFYSAAVKEPENIINVVEEKIEPYNYKEHGTIKLLHKAEDRVEEIRIR